MVRVYVTVLSIQLDQSANVAVTVYFATTTGRQGTVATSLPALDTISLLNTDVKTAVSDYLAANWPGDATWTLAEYVIFGAGQALV